MDYIVGLDKDYWEKVLEQINIFDVRILELVYQNGTYSLDCLMKDLKNTFRLIKSKPAFISNLNKLRDLGLIQIIKGCPLFVNDIIGIDDNIKKLIFIVKQRYKLN